MGRGLKLEGVLAQQSHGTALFVRYFHGGLSMLLVLLAVALFFVADGASRRAVWNDFGALLGANGVVSFFGIPILLAITARWRRATERPFRDVTLNVARGLIVVRMEEGEAHRIRRDDVATVHVENLPADLQRLVLIMRGRIPGDRYVFVVAEPVARSILAFVGSRPSSFDMGSRSTPAAGWTFSLSYAACCGVAVAGYALLRAHVPREVFEPYAATESVGWALGLGVGAFAPIHVLLGVLTTMPIVKTGIDGLSVRRFGTERFWPWSSISSVERRGTVLQLLLTHGEQARLRLWPVGWRRVEALARAVQQRVELAQAEAGESRPEEAERQPASVGYRHSNLDELELASRLVSAASPRGRRVRIARQLATRGASGREAVRVAAADVVEPSLRDALEEISRLAEASAEEGCTAEKRRALTGR